jgi:biopolymer transport protein ExbD/biopolymer transport protein TolR
MQSEDLPNKVRDLLTNRINKMVFIRSDSRARYEKVVDVVDNLRAAGVDQVGLLTEQVQDKGKQPPKGAATPAGE